MNPTQRRRGFGLLTIAVYLVALAGAYALASDLDQRSDERAEQSRQVVRQAAAEVDMAYQAVGEIARAAWRQGQLALLQAEPGSDEAAELQRACAAAREAQP